MYKLTGNWNRCRFQNVNMRK